MKPKLKVLMLHVLDRPDQFGGVERVVLDLAKKLPVEGIECLVVSNEANFLERIKLESNSTTKALSSLVRKNPILFVLQLKKVIKEFKPDIIHSHHRYATFVSQALLRTKIPILHSFHACLEGKKWLRLFGRASTACSEAVKKYYEINFNLPTKHATIIYNGIDLDDVELNQKHEKHEKVTALVVGRLEKEKGHALLFQALSLLKETVRDNLRIKVVGTGSQESELKALVDDLKLKNIVDFEGFKSVVKDDYKRADFVVVPSQKEGFGLVILEAYRYGKPVIATSVGGIPEVVESGRTGLLVKPENPEALADAIEELVLNPERRDSLGAAGYQLAQEKFGLNPMVRHFVDCYQKLLQRTGGNHVS